MYDVGVWSLDFGLQHTLTLTHSSFFASNRKNRILKLHFFPAFSLSLSRSPSPQSLSILISAQSPSIFYFFIFYFVLSSFHLLVFRFNFVVVVCASKRERKTYPINSVVMLALCLHSEQKHFFLPFSFRSFILKKRPFFIYIFYFAFYVPDKGWFLKVSTKNVAIHNQRWWSERKNEKKTKKKNWINSNEKKFHFFRCCIR